MKRYFLLAAASMIATNAYAHDQGVSNMNEGVTVSGFHNFVASYLDQDVDRGQHDVKLANDTEVHVTVMKKADAGYWYGAVIELEADVTEDFNEEGLNADKTYLFLQSDQWGRVELGANADASALIGVSASTFARGTGGIHGDWFTVISFPGDPHSGHSHGGSLAHLGHEDFIHADSLPLHEEHGATEDANKITYITPRIAGVQGGVSFIPDTGNVGTAAAFTDDAGHREFENAVSGGVNYSNHVGEASYVVSFTGQYGEEEAPDHNDLKAYAAGVNVSYRGFTVGGSYGDWNKSFTHASPTAEDSDYWSIGAAYEAGPAAVSVTYLDSDREGNELNMVSIGVDYRLAPGLVPFVEVNVASLDAVAPALQDNDATALLVGTLFNF